MKIQINITKEILERSKSCPSNVTNCAVALSVRELFPSAMIFQISAILILNEAGDPALGSRVDLPMEAQGFIRLFDYYKNSEDRASMNPISFEIDVPDYVINKIGIGTICKILSESKTLQHVNP